MSKPSNESTARNRSTRGRSTRASQNRPRGVSADRAKLIAIEYCLFHYPTLYTGGVPRRSSSANGVWVVPIKLESPEASISDEVGEVQIDARTGKVILSTPRSEVVAAGTRLYQERHDGRATAEGPSTKN